MRLFVRVCNVARHLLSGNRLGLKGKGDGYFISILGLEPGKADRPPVKARGGARIEAAYSET